MMQMATIDEADLILYQICMESNYDLHIIQTLKQSNSYVRAHLNRERLAWVDSKMEGILSNPSLDERIACLHELIDELQAEKSFLFVLHRSQQTT